MSTFQSFWHGKSPPPYQQLALKSFIDHGHQFILYSYDELEVPAGVELRDAQLVLPRDRLFLYKSGVGLGNASGFSDLFRFRLLHQEGGWWVDTDVVCLSGEIAEPDVYLGWGDHRLVGTAIMRFPKGHSLTLELYEAADRSGADIRFGDVGPALMTRVAKERGLADLLLPREEIYPIAPMDALDLLRPSRTEDVRAKIGAAPFLHLWNEILGRAAVLQWVAPPPGCYIRELFTRHGFPVGNRYCYSAAEMERVNVNFLRATDAATQFRHAKALQEEASALREKLAAAEVELAALRAKADPAGRG